MPIQLWKRLITNHIPSLYHRSSIAISLLPYPLNGKPPIKFANFCNQMAIPSTTPSNRGVVTDFLITKCGLTDQDITKAFRHAALLPRAKSIQNMEEVLELLKGCGLTTPAQVRRAVICNPSLLFSRSEGNIKSKLSILRTFINEKDIFRLVIRGAFIFRTSEEKLKSRSSLLQSLGLAGKTLSYLVALEPHVLTCAEERVVELCKQIENLGFKKGSQSFVVAMVVYLPRGKETIERKLQCLRSLGFSEKQISLLSSRDPQIMACSLEKLKRNVDFVVNSMGLLLAEFVKYPHLFKFSLEKRIIPRYRVMEALKSMRVQELRRDISLPRIIKLTEKSFLDKYVNENPKSSILLDIYHCGKAAKAIVNEEEVIVNKEEIHGRECLNQRDSGKF